MIKYNEAQSIRKTYEQIMKRLQEERLTFDTQLANFEKTLKSKKMDASQLEMMSRDANHAKEVAKVNIFQNLLKQAELARFEQQINEERKIREKELHYRKELVKQKLEINEKIDRKTLLLDDPNAETAVPKDFNKAQYDEMKEKKMQEFEETMRLIKEATGVNNIHEVVAKLKSQGDTNSQLTQLKSLNESRIEELKKRKVEIQNEYEDLKYTGEAKSSHSQSTLEELEKHCLDSEVSMQESRQKHDRLLKLLVNLQSGIYHLYDKLELIPVVRFSNLNSQTDLPPKSTVTEENLNEFIGACTKKIQALCGNLQGKELPDVNICKIS